MVSNQGLPEKRTADGHKVTTTLAARRGRKGEHRKRYDLCEYTCVRLREHFLLINLF